MKKTTFFMSAAMISILFISLSGCRHGMAGRCGPKAFKNNIELMSQKLSKELDLTDEQNKQLNRFKDELIVKISGRGKHNAEMFTVIREEIQKDTLDQQRLENLLENRAQFREDMHRLMLKKLAEFHAILTKEQRIKLNGLIEKLEKQFNEK